MMTPTYEQILLKLLKLDKKVREKQILYNNGPLSGTVSCCYLIGIDYTNGNIYLKNEDGEWELHVHGGGGGGIFDAVVEFSVNADPNDPGTTFNPNNPALTTVLYVSTIDFSQWTYDGAQYNTYIAPFWTTNGNPAVTGTNFLGSINNEDLRFRTNNTQVGVFDTSGNFGIANATPSEKLDITGNVRFSGALMPNNAAGTSGQFLTSAGVGAPPTWTAGVLTLSSIGATPNANGASISGTVLNLQPASASFGGIVTTSNQTLGAGNKTFGGSIGLFGTAIGSFDFITSSVSSNSFRRIALSNTNTGTGAGVGALYTNDGSKSLQYYMGSVANSYIPDGAYIHTNGTGGFRFVTSGVGAKVRWSTSNLVGLETGMYMRWDATSFEHSGIPALTTEDRLLGYVNASGAFSKLTVGSGLSLSGGTLTATGGSGANTALSNLAAVAINTSLISDTDNTDDLGSAAISWKDAYLRRILLNGSVSGTVTIQTAAAAGTYTLTLPTTDGGVGEFLQTDGSGVLSWAAGGAGSGTVNSGTQYRLAYYAANGTAVSENAAITANRVLISDANGVPTHATATATQLGYIDAATGTTGTDTTNLVFSASPVFTGTPTAPTAVTGTDTTQLATTEFVQQELDASTVYFSNRFAGAGTIGDPIDNILVTTTASSATPTPNADASTIFTVTALAANAVFAAPTGTPQDGQDLLIRIKDNATPRTLGWNAIYRAGTDFALPTTTVASETMYIQFIYNSADATWDAIGLTQGF